MAGGGRQHGFADGSCETRDAHRQVELRWREAARKGDSIKHMPSAEWRRSSEVERTTVIRFSAAEKTRNQVVDPDWLRQVTTTANQGHAPAAYEQDQLTGADGIGPKDPCRASDDQADTAVQFLVYGGFGFKL